MSSLSSGKAALWVVTGITAIGIAYIHHGQKVEREVRGHNIEKNIANTLIYSFYLITAEFAPRRPS